MSEALVASKTPFAVEVEEGKMYSWCSCGRSQSQPFCDGSHKDTEFKPLTFKAEKTGTLYLCGCKTTKKSPHCDGSHSQLG